MTITIKTKFILLSLSLLLLSIDFSPCDAEIIYLKDGKVIKEKIIYRSKHSIWLNYKPGSLGINMQNIDKIENDDGSISKYDLRTLYKKSQDSIEKGEYSEAIKLYNILIETLPNDVEIHYLRGILNHKIGEFDEAIKDYDFLIKNEAADAKILNNLGSIYASKKEYKEAKKWFARAIKEDSRLVEAHNNIAAILLQTENYKYAIAEYKRVIKLDPRNTEALYNLGLIYMQNGNYVLAKKQWEKVLEFQPEDNEVKSGLEYIKAHRD